MSCQNLYDGSKDTILRDIVYNESQKIDTRHEKQKTGRPALIRYCVNGKNNR